MIRNFLPKPGEIRELSIMFNESLRGFGYHSLVSIPRRIELPGIGYEENVGYDEADQFNAYISFDSSPKPKLLNQLGWNSDSEDNKPLIAYISRYLQPINEPRDVLTSAKEIEPYRFTKISLDYSYQDKGKEFIVTRCSSNQFNPIYYIITVVPYRKDMEPNSIPMQDQNLNELSIEEGDTQFRFIGTPRDHKVDIKY